MGERIKGRREVMVVLGVTHRQGKSGERNGIVWRGGSEGAGEERRE